MFRTYALILTLLITPFITLAQGEANLWYYGYATGLDFNSGQPLPQPLTNNASTQNEGTATISDRNGNLLMYTTGVSVYNSVHSIMPNGSGLLGHWSSTQSALIVQKPGNPQLQYIFTSPPESFLNPQGIHYSTVNLCLDNGLGMVTEKNVPVNSMSTERLVEVKHANNFDSWVITHDWLSDTFQVYLVNSAGVNLNPVISATGSVHEFTWGAVGYMKASPDGSKIAVVIEGKEIIEILDFDRTTGQLSNPITFQADTTIPTLFSTPNTYLYGLEFSPDGSKLYYPILYTGDLYQFDLNAGSPAAVLASVTQVSNISGVGFSAAQLGPDGKIYLNEFADSTLHTIDNPNAPAGSIQITANALSTSPTNSAYGFPNFSNSLFDQRRPLTRNFCTADTTRFSILDSSGLTSGTWFFGDSTGGVPNSQAGFSAAHQYSAPGFYQAFLTFSEAGVPDTIHQLVRIDSLPADLLPPDTLLCQAADFTLETGNFCSYFWQDSSLVDTFLVSQAGQYRVTVSNGCGCFEDSIQVSYANSIGAFLGPDQSLCIGQDSINLNVNGLGFSQTWQDGTLTPQYAITDTGEYWVTVINGSCTLSDTLLVQAGQVEPVQLPDDTTICQSSNLSLSNLSSTSSGTRLWQNGSSASSIAAEAAGTYWLQITSQDGCETSDTLLLAVADSPEGTLGNDTVLCSDDSLMIGSASWTTLDVQWSTGQTEPEIAITAPGTYWVALTNAEGCTGSDTISVRDTLEISLDLGPDRALCEGSADSIVLLETGNYPILWSTGNTSETLVVNEEGMYAVTIASACAVLTDSIEVRIDRQPNAQKLLPADTLICDTGVVVEVSIPASANYSVSWVFPQQVDGPAIRLSQATTLVLEKRNACGFLLDSTAVNLIDIPFKPMADTTFCPSENLLLRAGFIPDSIRWTTGEKSTFITLNSAGEYGFDAWVSGCRFSDTIIVRADETLCDDDFCTPFIPNVITPNGDGFNDYLSLNLSCLPDDLEFAIYNRWGARVFQSQNPALTWDGATKNETNLSEAVYYYELSYTSTTNAKLRSFRGAITVLR